jgi:cysteine desulfurase/selenocysteine lyase
MASQIRSFDPNRYRSQFPVVHQKLFLNHASEAPVSLPVRQRIDEYLDSAKFDPDATMQLLGRLKGLLAQLFGGSESEYALMPNTGTAMGIVAGGYDWQPGDNIVLPAEEYPANQYPWLALRDRGVDVRIAPLTPELRVDPDRIAALVDEKTRMIALSAVGYLSGFRADLKRLSQIAHSVDALLVVDVIQAAGAVPIDVEADGIDIMAAGSYKWLLGPIGCGFAYFRPSAMARIRPLLPGAFSSVKGAEDYQGEFELLPTARRYETGCMAFSLQHGWTGGLELLLDASIEAVHRHLLCLTDRLIAGLQAKGCRLLSPVDHPAERSGIIAFTLGDSAADEALTRSLRQQEILIGFRGGRCRVSPHFYNTEADIDRLLGVIR